MQTSEKTNLVSQALVQAIGEIKTIKKDSKNPFLKNKYASLDTILESVKPIMSKHKLAVMQNITDAGVETVVMHEGGEWISSGTMLIPTQEAKGLSNAQIRGVAITYSRRYQLGAMLGIATEEDEDGQQSNEQPDGPAKKAPVKKAADKQPAPAKQTPGEKPALNKNMPAYKRAYKHMLDGGSLDDIRKAYVISEDLEKELINPTHEVFKTLK